MAGATFIDSIRSEFLRYRKLAEGAMHQMSDEELTRSDATGSNSVAVICQHIAGNFRSRFTDFLTTDGEKPWRQREEEFDSRSVSRAEILRIWDEGWTALFGALDQLSDADLARTVTIRRQPLLVHEALHRSVTHLSYHVGQIVFIAKGLRGDTWESLSIPRGQSVVYNAAPTKERG